MDYELHEIITSLDTSKAIGIASALCKPLCQFFLTSLSYRQIPTEWKINNITPVLKSGNWACVSNYRPISLLCSTSKVLERLVYISVWNSWPDPFPESSTVSQRSSLQQLLVFYEDILESLSMPNSQTDVCMGFAKAFDTNLLFKLKTLGVNGKVWLWPKAYLRRRMQCVSIEENRSGLLQVVSGVPQGSIFVPLLFHIYTKDLPLSAISSQVFLFADDTDVR